MIKLKSLLFESKILIPRRNPEERERGFIAEYQRIIQRYIKNGCRGDLDLRRTPIKILPDNLTHIGGNLFLSRSKIEDLNNLEKVERSLWGMDSTPYLKTLGKLSRVGQYADFEGSSIETLGNLEYVGKILYLRNTPNLKSLGKLKYVGGDLILNSSNILNFMSIEDIKKQLEVRGNILP